MVTITPLLSNKFRFWSFISMFLLVFVHGYNLQIRYLQPWTTPDEALTMTSFTEYFLANGLFRFRIPMLFIISGFLFAMNDYRPYGERTKKRLKSLLVPYLLWSAIGLALTYVLEMIPATRLMVESSSVVQIDETRSLLHDYRWYEILGRWLFHPVPYQLWFIRVLFMYNLAYPAIRWCVLHKVAKWIFFPIALFLWLSTTGLVLVEGEGLLFFSLGVWIQKTNFNIEEPRKWLKSFWWGVAFVGFAAIKTFLAFKGQEMFGRAVFPVMTLMHKTVVLSGLIFCWYSLDLVVKWFMERRWFVWLSAFSFIIYALHTPLIAYLINPTLALFQPFFLARLVAYITLSFAIIALCVGVGAFLRKFMPGVYSVLTGGRGFYKS